MKGTLDAERDRTPRPPTRTSWPRWPASSSSGWTSTMTPTDGTVGELLSVHFGFHPLAVAGRREVRATTPLRRLRRLRLPGGPGGRPDGQRAGRGALFLDRHLCGHRAPRRLPGHPCGARADRPPQVSADGGLAADRHRLPDHRRAGRRLLSRPHRLRRQDRRPRRRHPQGPHRSAVGHPLRHEAQPDEHAQGHRPAAGHDGRASTPASRRARHDRRGGAATSATSTTT